MSLHIYFNDNNNKYCPTNRHYLIKLVIVILQSTLQDEVEYIAIDCEQIE